MNSRLHNFETAVARCADQSFAPLSLSLGRYTPTDYQLSGMEVTPSKDT